MAREERFEEYKKELAAKVKLLGGAEALTNNPAWQQVRETCEKIAEGHRVAAMEAMYEGHAAAAQREVAAFYAIGGLFGVFDALVQEGEMARLEQQKLEASDAAQEG